MNKMFYLQRLWQFVPLCVAVGLGILLGWIYGESRWPLNAVNAVILCSVAYFSANTHYPSFDTRMARLGQESVGQTFYLAKAARHVSMSNLAKILIRLAMVVTLLSWGTKWLPEYNLSTGLFFVVGIVLFVTVVVDIIDWSGYLYLGGLAKRPLTPNKLETFSLFLTATAFAAATVVTVLIA